MTTGAKPSSIEAVLDVLRQHPGATAAQVAEQAGIGRSTAARTLANLETQGRATRRRGKAEAGGRAAPDRWSLAPEAPTDRADAGQPASDQPATEPAGTAQPSGPHGHAGVQDAPPAAADDTAAATPPTGRDASGQRLRPGALRTLVGAWLAERPGQAFTPTRIGKELGRSAGAVGNALATMADAGEVTQASAKPRRYMATAQPSDAAGGGATATAG
jgi:hypothetical protein